MKLATQYSYLTNDELVSLIYLPGNTKLDLPDLLTELTWRLAEYTSYGGGRRNGRITTTMHMMPEVLQDYFRGNHT